MRVWSKSEAVFLESGFIPDERYLPNLKSRIRAKVRTMTTELNKAVSMGLYNHDDVARLFEALDNVLLENGLLDLAERLKEIKALYFEAIKTRRW